MQFIYLRRKSKETVKLSASFIAIGEIGEVARKNNILSRYFQIDMIIFLIIIHDTRPSKKLLFVT